MGAIIAGVVCPSTVDWMGKNSLVFFFAGCNFRCPWCYNYKLIPQHGKLYTNEKIENVIRQNKKITDAVVLSGGEPTLQDQGCESIFKLAKYYRLETMLNTNLSQPTVIIDLIEKNLVDKIAADVKAPMNPLEYKEMSGCDEPYLNLTVKNTIKLINNLGIPLELRTTVVGKTYSDGTHLYKLIDEIAPLASEWHIQQFDDRDVLDPTLKGRVVGKDKLLEYAHYAKQKGIKKVIVVTREDGFIVV